MTRGGIADVYPRGEGFDPSALSSPYNGKCAADEHVMLRCAATRLCFGCGREVHVKLICRCACTASVQLMFRRWCASDVKLMCRGGGAANVKLMFRCACAAHVNLMWRGGCVVYLRN